MTRHYDYSQILMDITGEPCFEPVPGQRINGVTGLTDSGAVPQMRELTIGNAIIATCATPLADDEKLDLVKKFSIGEIAGCVKKNLGLTAEQLGILKERVGKVWASPVRIYVINSYLDTEYETNPPIPTDKIKR